MVDNLVDDSTAGGDLSSIEKDLRAAAAQRSASNEKPQKGRKQVATEVDEAEDAVLPEKLRGKSITEIAQLYLNLESAHGRMANDLGTQRKLTDVVLGLKRENDLSNNAAPEKVQIKSDELFENPTAALERFQAPRDAENDQRVARLEQQLQAQAFTMRHPDYQQVAAEPEFVQWIASSPTRLRAAELARTGDWDAGSDLLTEYKASKPNKVVDDEDDVDEVEEEKPLSKARKASLESGSQGNAGARKVGKILKRADLMKLRVEQPDVYYQDELQEEIIAAYAEGRVK